MAQIECPLKQATKLNYTVKTCNIRNLECDKLLKNVQFTNS